MNNEAWIQKMYTKIIQQQNNYVLVSVNIKDFKYLNLKYGRKQGNDMLVPITWFYCFTRIFSLLQRSYR